MQSGQVLLDVGVLAFIVGTLIPLLTGLLTKSSASSQTKAIVMLALDVIAGGVTVALQANGSVNLQTWVMGMAVAFLSSAAFYRTFWKPTGVSSLVNETTANFGIGR